MSFSSTNVMKDTPTDHMYTHTQYKHSTKSWLT